MMTIIIFDSQARDANGFPDQLEKAITITFRILFHIQAFSAIW